jgi:hypothetical protein
VDQKPVTEDNGLIKRIKFTDNLFKKLKNNIVNIIRYSNLTKDL